MVIIILRPVQLQISFRLVKLFRKKKFNNIEIVLGDIRDYDLILKYTKNSDIVVNLAALIGIPYSYDAPKSYIDTNIGTIIFFKHH